MGHRRAGIILGSLVLGAIVGWFPILSWSQMLRSESHLPTQVLPWRPTQEAPGRRFVGPAACAKCHPAQTATQPATAMGKALKRVAECRILQSQPRLTFRQGAYRYEISRQRNQSLYLVSDGINTITASLQFCFGNGQAGQTYVFERNGVYYESRVSYYQDTNGLDLTLGFTSALPASLEAAAGRPLPPEETRHCFSCHATAAVAQGRLQPDHLIPGVSCEACHGPGEKHVAAMQAGRLQEKQIFNPKSLNNEELSQEFCGACHRSWQQVAASGITGVGNVRFQPYRIFNSKCYNPDDRRISCTACHDPHANPRRDAAFYDAKCLACHQSAPPARANLSQPAVTARAAPACPVGKQECIKCHMPKYEVPGGHFKFADHWIRIARPTDPYPN